MIIRLISVSDHMQLPEFHDGYAKSKLWGPSARVLRLISVFARGVRPADEAHDEQPQHTAANQHCGAAENGGQSRLVGQRGEEG